MWSGPNPPDGAIINYYLKSDQPDATITVTDKAGKAIRTIRNAPNAAGVNRYVWDLRYDGPKRERLGGRGGGGQGGGRRCGPGGGAPAREEAPGGGRFGGGGAPLVVPGEYIVELHAPDD